MQEPSRTKQQKGTMWRSKEAICSLASQIAGDRKNTAFPRYSSY